MTADLLPPLQAPSIWFLWGSNPRLRCSLFPRQACQPLRYGTSKLLWESMSFFCIYMQYLFTYFIFGTIQLWLNWIRVSRLCIYLLYPNISRYFFKVLTNMLSPEYTESTVQQKRKSEYFGSSYRWQEKGEKNQFSLVQTKHCGFTL